MTDVAGKTAFITGGASGLGLATAKALAAKGASVILADIDGAGADGAAETLRGEGANALGLQLDVTSEDSWAAAGIAQFRMTRYLEKDFAE
jgi:NAD(P)-dependent dehydrogenase (short-subunit alcohol dehydrogenase family)